MRATNAKKKRKGKLDIEGEIIMNSEIYGFLIGGVFIVVQALVLWGLAKILTILTNKVLPDNEE